MVLGFKFSLSLSNITHVFRLYARISSTILNLWQDFRKLAAFALLLTKFYIFLKSMCLLLANFLKFIFNQKEKHGFIWSKTFDFVPKTFKYLLRRKDLFLKSSCFLLFKNTYLKEHLWVAASIYFDREASQKCKNITLQTNLKRVLFSWSKDLFNSK